MVLRNKFNNFKHQLHAIIDLKGIYYLPRIIKVSKLGDRVGPNQQIRLDGHVVKIEAEENQDSGTETDN